MNTRRKIITKEELAAAFEHSPAILVIGSFDPLLALHSERLAQVGRLGEAKLVVAVADPSDTVLLPLSARLEMVAAIAVVDFVLSYESGLETRFPWAAIYNDSALHDQWTVDFKQHVRRRSQPINA